MDPKTEFYRRLAENMSDLVALHAPDGRYLWVSPSSTRILGYSPESMIGRDPYELFHPDDIDSIRNDTHVKAVQGDGNILIRYRIRRADDRYIWFETLTQPILNDAGDAVELHTTSRDVTEQQVLQAAFRENEAVYRAGLESLEEGVVVLNAGGRVIATNAQAREMMPCLRSAPKSVALDEILDESIYPDGRVCPPLEFPSTMTLRTGACFSQLLLGVASDAGSGRRWLSFNSRPVPIEKMSNAEAPAVVLSCADVTERIEHDRQLKLWSTVFQFSNEAMALINDAGAIIDLNRAFESFLQCQRTHWLGQSIDSITFNTQTEGIFSSKIWPELDEQGFWAGEVRVRDGEGTLRVAWASLTRVDQSEVTGTHYTLSMNDFSERVEKEEVLRFHAGHDPLTKLPNRLLLSDRFDVAMNNANRNAQRFACLFLDLDLFKPINDQYGHAMGDGVLKEVAARLQGIVRSMDTVARLGGDEFCVLIYGLESACDYRLVADRIHQSIAQPIVISDQEVQLGVSIGVAIFPEHGNTQSTLMAASDRAMYHAKRQAERIIFVDELD